MPSLENIKLEFISGKEKKTVFDGLSITFSQGKTTAVLGPSGCGKTSLLRLLAGTLTPTSGNVTRETQSISYVFQDTALLPWLTALENVNLVLSDSAQTLESARFWLSAVELADEADRYPHELSGGMRQRVALARALCTDAELLLLDEPFRGLDPELHERMRELVRRVRSGKTTVLVTHDRQDLCIADAFAMLEPDAQTLALTTL